MTINQRVIKEKTKSSIYYFDPSIKQPITLDLIFDTYHELNDYAELKKNLMNKIIKIEEEKKRKKYRSDIVIEDLLLSLSKSILKHKELLNDDNALDNELLTLRDKSNSLLSEGNTNTPEKEEKKSSNISIDDIIQLANMNPVVEVPSESDNTNLVSEQIPLSDMEKVFKSIIEDEEVIIKKTLVESYQKVNFKITNYKFKESFSFLSDYLEKKKLKLEQRKNDIKERKKLLKESNVYDFPIKYDNETLISNKKRIYTIQQK